MLIKNEHYNPNWEIIHDYHHEERERLSKEKRAWWRDMSKNKDYKEIEQMNAEFDFHHNICRLCLHKYQHEYVADFAEYLFKNSSLEMDESNFPPPESFKTVDEVMEAWARLNMKLSAH